MFGLRSARGRAILAGTVFVLLLAAVGTVAVWRAGQDEQRLENLDRTSSAATALEGGQANFWWAEGALSALVISGDPAFVDIYDNAFAGAELDLAEARAQFLAMGKTAEVSAVDGLSRRIDEFNEQVRPTFDILIQIDRQAALQLANATLSEMKAETDALVRDWQAAIRGAQQDAEADRAAAERSAEVSLLLLLSLSGAALATGIGTVATLVGSVVKPLAALQASARAITAGHPETRAKVSGPDEVASLARDFNQMTDALSAKTEALQESESRYRLLAENATDMIWTMDMNLRHTYISPSVLRLRGYTAEEAMAQTLDQMLTPASIDVAMKALTEELAIEELEQKDLSRSRTLEFEHLCRDGSTVWLEVTMTFLRDENGRAVGILGASRDVGERKRAEEALRESEKRYRLLADNASDIIWTMDMNLRFTYESPSVTRIRGYSPEEAMALTIEETLTPASLEVAQKALAEELAPEAMKTKDLSRSRTLELEHTCKDGSTVWLEVTTTFLRDQDGRVVGLLGASRDISERKRAEAELRTKDSAIASAISAIALSDLEGNLTYVNPSALKMWGYDDEREVLGRPSHRFWQIREKALEVGEALRDQGSWTGELVATRRDGSTFDVEMLASMVTDEAGKPICIMGSFVDISERKRAEEALRESENKYRTLVENLPQRVFFKDRNSVYVSCNENYSRDLRINPNEIVGKTDLDFYPTELADKYRADDKKIMDSGETEDIEERYVQDGREAFVHTVKTPVKDEHGEVVGVLGVFWDITERKRAEDERERLHAELEVRAITDGLTGLYNRTHFYERLSEETERSGRYNHGFAVVMMDVDNFKSFNDSRGHQMGDEMLRLVADSIRSALRRSDLAFRYGGDEFAAILLHANAARARAVIDRINRRLAKSLNQTNDEAAARVSLSAGLACFPNDGRTPDKLVRSADAALYSAKWGSRARSAAGEEYAIESLAAPAKVSKLGLPSNTASSLAAALRELSVPDALAELNLRTVAALGTLAEIKDPYIRGHQERTSDWAATVAEGMGLSSDRVRSTRLAGLLHDLGKASISKRILNKPGKLTEEEFAEIKEHPALGSMMIISEIEALQQVVPIVRHHHEHFDGKGYPDGLAGQDIPLEARILAVVDAFDAMTHERAYRKALSREEALAELERGAGIQFDPAVVEAFLALAPRESTEPATRKLPTSEDKELAAAPTRKA